MIPKWTHIIIHHSATEDDGIRDDWAGIKKYHTSWRYRGDIITPEQGNHLIAEGKIGVIKPWRDIGYHWGVENVKGRMVVQKGRPEDLPGAHCEHMNGVALGICCVGDFDHHVPSDAVYYNCAQLCALLMKKYPKITVGNIEPHRKYSSKTCPGSLFDMNRLLGYVRTLA